MTDLGEPVHTRLLDAELRRIDDLSAAEARRVNDLREADLRNTADALAAKQKMDEALRLEVQRAQDKFEQTVEARLIVVNEFRGALSDLSTQMATRRELEPLAEAIADLRSRIDVGPPELHALQSRADTGGGASLQGQYVAGRLWQFAALIASAAAVVVVLVHG